MSTPVKPPEIPRLRGVKPPPDYQPVAPEKMAKPEKTQRSLPVTLIAIYQFGRAAILLLTGALVVSNPDFDLDSSPLLQSLIFIVSRAKIGSTAEANTVAIRLLVLGVWIAILGVGCLMLQQWARRSLLGTSLWGIYRLGRLLLFLGVVGYTMPMQTQVLYGILVFLDVLTVSALLHEAKAFGVEPI